MQSLKYEERRAILCGAMLPRAASPPPPRSPVVYEGFATVEVVGPDGTVKSRHTGWNAAVSYGMSRLADFIATGTAAASGWMNYLGIGTSSTAPTSNDAGLLAATGTPLSATKSVAGARTARYTASFNSDNPAGTATINEVGLLQTNVATASMGARATLSPAVTKGASDTLNVTYDIIIQGT
jgi:hypothetical protein